VKNAARRAWSRGDRAAVRELRQQLRVLPSGDPRDPGFRRLRYARYADDHLLGFTGPKAEAEEIKARLAQFLRDDLKLELGQEKTLITHARSGAARFLGYEISVQHSRDRPQVNGVIGLRVPRAVVTAKCAPYLAHGKPERRTELMNLTDLLIISTYGAEYRGIVQYYLLAGDVWRLNRLEWVASTSMLKTLAAKHGSTVTKMGRKYKARIGTPYGPRTCFEARVERAGRKPLAGRFGGIPLIRQKKAVLTDRQPVPATGRKELTTRLLTGRCEWCERRATVEVHQVRCLADLTRPGRPQPEWAHLMATMRRKTLVVCASCHQAIHAGQPAIALTE
jgi:Type II intron maturase